MVTAVLMGAGYSYRMERDKLLLDFGGMAVIEHTMRVIGGFSFDKRVLIERERRYREIGERNGFIVVENERPFEGQSASVRLGVECSDEDSAVMFFVGDQPCMTIQVIETLVRRHEEHPEDIIVPVAGGQFRNPVLFPALYRRDLLEIKGDEGGRSVIRKYPEHVRRVSFTDVLPFCDIDTLEDYQFLLKASRYK